MINEFSLIGAGITLAVGVLALFTWLNARQNQSYLYFSLVGIFAGISFIFSRPELNGDYSSIYLLANAIYWSAFLWFINEYTKTKRYTTPIINSVLLISAYLAFLLGWQHWNILAHIALVIMLSFSGYAIYKTGAYKDQFILSTTCIVFFVLALEELLYINIGLTLWFRDDINFMPLDFYGLLFTLVMGGKMVSDVSRKYTVEKELEDKVLQWDKLMENIRLIVVRMNKDGIVEYANQYFEDITGYTNTEILGKDWFDIMPPKEEKSMRKSKLLEDSKSHVQKNCIITKSGVERWILWSDIHLLNGQNEKTGLFSIGHDVTNHEQDVRQIKVLKNQLEKEKLELEEKLGLKSPDESSIIGSSEPIQYAIRKAKQVAGTSSTVLIEGETGVGKELFANLIHQNSSRKNKSLVKVNCAAIPSELMESEFFGHEKGAFTGASYQKEGKFELANGGTILLDEVADIPIELQPKLLRILQNGEFQRVGSARTIHVDVRIMSATNKNLLKLVNDGRFREDLYYRLNVYPITIPPLRSRKDDIPLLVRNFVSVINNRFNKHFETVSKHDMERLTNYHWPGNVRQLENIIERAIINSIEPNLKFDTFDQAHSMNSNDLAAITLEEMEKEFIIQALEESNWRINGSQGAAEKLNINPNTLRSKMKKLQIQKPSTDYR